MSSTTTTLICLLLNSVKCYTNCPFHLAVKSLYQGHIPQQQPLCSCCQLSESVDLQGTSWGLHWIQTPDTLLDGTQPYSASCLKYVNTVKPVLRDHCHERPPVLKDHTFLAEGPTFQDN